MFLLKVCTIMIIYLFYVYMATPLDLIRIQVGNFFWIVELGRFLLFASESFHLRLFLGEREKRWRMIDAEPASFSYPLV